MSPNMDIDVPGSLASNILISAVVVAIAISLVITIYVCTRRQRTATLRAESIGRRWINEVQYEIRVPPQVHVQEHGGLQHRFLESGDYIEYIELNRFSEVRRRPYRSLSLRGLGRMASASWSVESSLELEREGRAWYSRPVGGEYDDADVDSRGRVRWVSFGRRWGDEESSVVGESFVTALEG